MNKGFLIAGVSLLALAVLTPVTMSLSKMSRPEFLDWRDDHYAKRKMKEEWEKDKEDYINDSKENSKGGTLRDFMNGKLGDKIACHSSYPVSDSTLTVSTYINGDKVRVDYSMDPPVKGQSNLRMITRDGYGYLWGDSTIGRMFDGIRIPLSDETGEIPEDQGMGMVDYDAQLPNCNSWEVDESLFEVPEGLNFQDMSKMMPGEDEEMDNCAMCQQLPGQQEKDQCLSMFDCE